MSIREQILLINSIVATTSAINERLGAACCLGIAGQEIQTTGEAQKAANLFDQQQQRRQQWQHPHSKQSSSFLIKNLIDFGNNNNLSTDYASQVVDLRVKPTSPSQSCPKVVGEQSSQVATHSGRSIRAEEDNSTRRMRTMFSECQLAGLESRFARNKYLTTSDRIKIANYLQLNQLQVKTWFQVSIHVAWAASPIAGPEIGSCQISK